MCSERGCECTVGFAYGVGACAEESAFVVGEVEFHDFLNAVFAENTGNADAYVGLSVFAFEKCGAADCFMCVVDDGVYYLSSSGSGSHPS